MEPAGAMKVKLEESSC